MDLAEGGVSAISDAYRTGSTRYLTFAGGRPYLAPRVAHTVRFQSVRLRPIAALCAVHSRELPLSQAVAPRPGQPPISTKK